MSQNANDCAYCWNSDAFSYDGIITFTDLIEMIIFVYNTLKLRDSGTLFDSAESPKIYLDKQSPQQSLEAQSPSGAHESTFETKASFYNKCKVIWLELYPHKIFF